MVLSLQVIVVIISLFHYYQVYLSFPDFQLVHTDKMSCLAMMKKYRGSRFKAFRSYEEALQFAENGPEVAITQDTNGLDGNVNAERPSPFRGPKSQDLVKFRKSIEKDDVTYFTKVGIHINLGCMCTFIELFCLLK